MELDEEHPTLVFGEDESRVELLCDVLVIGTWSRRSRSWRWGWANDSCDARLTRPLVAMKRFGEANGLARLWRSQFDVGEEDACGVASTVLDVLPHVEGMYRVPGESVSLFLAVVETRWMT
jgi:hypothetical protein